uniref:Uncharacterized protein n=1 Tax=Arundo donax TaxID=35708 RepID=A0A0A8ZIK6_ARUDO
MEVHFIYLQQRGKKKSKNTTPQELKSRVCLCKIQIPSLKCNHLIIETCA